MATISPENRTRPADDSDPEPVGVTEDQANETVEPQTNPVPSNGRYWRVTGFAIGEWAPVPTEEIDNIIVKLHESQTDIDTLNRRRLWLLKYEHKPAAEVMKRIRQIEFEYTNTRGETFRPIRTAQIFHDEFQPLKDYLSLIEIDEEKNQQRIESLQQEAAAQQTENEGETPDSRPNGSRSPAEIASELSEARQTGEWYDAEEQSINDRLDAINREIREQPKIAEPLRKCEELLYQLQAAEDDLKAAEATAIKDDPELAEAVAELDQAREDSARVQARIKQITNIMPEDSAQIQEVLDCWHVNIKLEEAGDWQRNPSTTPEPRRVNEQLLGADWKRLVPRHDYYHYSFKKLLEDRKHPDKTKEGRL